MVVVAFSVDLCVQYTPQIKYEYIPCRYKQNNNN
jgi:hypothetical protein